MLSTLLNYRYYAGNLTKSLERIEKTTTVANDTAYYDQNIGKVKDVDDFLDDNRLYTYALKAYGLEDQAASKGFIRKVIESDLSDKSSFANALADSRYRKFAEAFNFKTTEAVKTAQSTGQNENLIEAYSEYRVRQAVSLAAKTTHFEARMATIASVDEFLADADLFDVAMRSIGRDPALISKSYIRDVMTGAIDDNTATAGDDAFFVLAEKFNFGADGTLAAGGVAMDAADTSQLIHDFNVKTDNMASSKTAAYETAHYTAHIGGVTDVDDLLSDSRMVDYIRTAFGVTATSDTSFLRNILTSDAADPNSTLNRMPAASASDIAYKTKLTALRDAFNFTANGSVAPGESAQSAAATASTTDGYYDRYQSEAAAKDASRTSTYKLQLSKMKSLSDLLAKDAVFGRDALDYVLRAFDLDPATESITRIRRVLQSDVSDPNSYVNKLKDPRYERLAAAFNFDSAGKVRAQQQVVSTATMASVGTKYTASFGSDLSESKKQVLKADTAKYLEAAGSLRSLDDLLANKTVLDYTLKAFGLENESLSTAELKKILTSDLGASASFANSFKDSRYSDFAASFNFDTSGKVKLGEDSVQQPAQRLSTENLYLLATMETEAGETSEGSRLALYFLRNAPSLTTPLKILADKALVEVVKTSLGLPASFSQLEIDKQAEIIAKRIDLADFQDTKKLDAFLSRFAALYDMNSTDGSTASPLLGLFNGGSTSSGGGLLSVL